MILLSQLNSFENKPSDVSTNARQFNLEQVSFRNAERQGKVRVFKPNTRRSWTISTRLSTAPFQMKSAIKPDLGSARIVEATKRRVTARKLDIVEFPQLVPVQALAVECPAVEPRTAVETNASISPSVARLH